MKVDEWKEKDHKLPLWQFLGSIHWFTELVKIHVVIGDAWIDEDRRLSDFYLTENAFRGVFQGDYSETERLLEYYADAPIWNVCATFTSFPYDHHGYDGKRLEGHHVTSCIVAHVHFRDIRDAWYREKADIQRRKKNEQRQKRKEAKAQNERNHVGN